MKYIATILTSLYNCETYLESFFDNVFEIEGFEQFELLLLHNAPKQTETDIIQRRIEGHSNIKHIIIPQREGLYTTWNRGILLANADYITNWNVDDRRFKDSIMNQYNTLIENRDAAIAYGDKYIKNTTNNTLILSTEPNTDVVYNKARYAHVIGCFPMWKKSIHQKIGYFDEQFKLCADLDFQFRIVYNGLKLVKVQKPLGTFLWNNTNLSAQSVLQLTEGSIIRSRYGIAKYYDLFSVIRNNQIKKNEILQIGKWYLLEKYIPNYNNISHFSLMNWSYILTQVPYYLMKHLKQQIKRCINH